MELLSIGSFLWWLLFIVVWIALAFWPARVAGRKGHSFFGFFVFSLFFFPAALSLPTWSATGRRCRRSDEAKKVECRTKGVSDGDWPCSAAGAGVLASQLSGEIIEELERLRESDTVRVIDALAVYKDAAGDMEVHHLSNLTDSEAIKVGSRSAR